MEFQFDSSQPVYLQIASAIESMIIAGQFRPGEKLPSVREIAAQSRTNPNTVVKALGEVEKKGLIETRRTAGKFVCLNEKALEDTRDQQAKKLCREFILSMQSLGCSQAQIMSLLESEFADAGENSRPE